MARITLSESPSLGVLVLALAACDGSSSPTAPPPTPIAAASWAGTGVATLVSCSPPDQCGVIGESFPGQRWTAAWSDSSIGLYSAGDDLYYRGTINGWRFVATVSFEGYSATLEGEFSSDHSSFEALQTSDALINGIMTRVVMRQQATGSIQ